MGIAEAALWRLREILLDGVEAADEAAIAMGEVVERGVNGQLGKSSHPPGTPTPAAPGGPPAMITGRLRDSVITKFVGDGTVLVGATTPYARIQQFGGYSGVNRATRTPARPYLEAALAESSGEAWDAAIDVIVERVFGG